VKLEITVFVKIVMLEKWNSKEILLIDFDFAYRERCNFLTFHHVMANLIRKT